MCAAAAFFGLAHTFKHGDFVRVTLFMDRLAPGPRRVLEIVTLAIAAWFCGYLFWSAAKFVYESWQFNDMANGLIVLPLWIPQSSFVLGAALLFLAVVDELVIVLRGMRPTYVTAVEERHARGDFSEDI
jgi:TRAP-type C4-dicarboxylate transport system permease small subunit